MTAPMMRLPAARASLAEAESSFYVKVKRGLIPKPVRIGARAVAWPSDEIDAIVKARIGGASDDQVRELVGKLHARRAKALIDAMEVGNAAA